MNLGLNWLRGAACCSAPSSSFPFCLEVFLYSIALNLRQLWACLHRNLNTPSLLSTRTSPLWTPYTSTVMFSLSRCNSFFWRNLQFCPAPLRNSLRCRGVFVPLVFSTYISRWSGGSSGHHLARDRCRRLVFGRGGLSSSFFCRLCPLRCVTSVVPLCYFPGLGDLPTPGTIFLNRSRSDGRKRKWTGKWVGSQLPDRHS